MRVPSILVKGSGNLGLAVRESTLGRAGILQSALGFSTRPHLPLGASPLVPPGATAPAPPSPPLPLRPPLAPAVPPAPRRWPRQSPRSPPPPPPRPPARRVCRPCPPLPRLCPRRREPRRCHYF